MFVVAYTGGPFAGDFHHELYPEAEMLLRGESPYPSPDQEIAGTNFVWPPVSAYLVSPLTLVPPGVADVLIVGIGLACFALALWVIGVRDWRVYGAFALWPEVVAEMRVSHLTPVIALFLACAWRWRDARARPGLLIGLSVAVKFFVWPVGVWLASTRRIGAALVAAAVAAASLLLVLPFTGLDEYIRILLKLGRTFDQDSYTIFGLLVQADVSDARCARSDARRGSGLLARRGSTAASPWPWLPRSSCRPSSGSTTSRSRRSRSRSLVRGSRGSGSCRLRRGVSRERE